MLKSMDIKNLTVFPKATLHFSPNLNVIIGENGCGKTHLLKAAYAIIAANASAAVKKTGMGTPTKTVLQRTYAEKLKSVFRPESLGRLVSRKQGLARCEMAFSFKNSSLNCKFAFTTKSKSEVQINTLPKSWQPKAPVFLPTRELLTLYPGFVSIYDNHYLEFDETYRDTCVLLGVPALRGAKEKKASKLLKPLEDAMGGKVVLDFNGRFYLKIPGQGNMEMPLVAEGLRKLAMLVRLIGTGSLIDKGYLFWDEPETNLNPKLIKLIAQAILQLCKNGIQVFIASHSLFLLREIEILSANKEFKALDQRFFALRVESNRVLVEQGEAVEDLETLVLLDEELTQSNRFLNAGV